MAETVGNVCDELVGVAFGIAQQTVDGLDDYLDDVDILPLVESSDIVCLGNFPVVKYGVDGACVIFDKQPVTHVLALAIDWKRLAMTNVVDEQRDELFGELVWTVVVRAVGHDSWHAVCVVVCAHEMVGRCLRCRIGRMGIVLCGFEEEFGAIGVMALG